MYEEFFGLSEKPFDLLPNPRFLYPSRSHRRVRTFLQHGIRDKAGFILLTGEVGSGKTTIVREIIKSELSNVSLAKVFNTKVDSHQLLSMINDDYGLETHGRDKAALLRDLNAYLIEEYAQGRQVVLIIDEAQNLSHDLLEEVRMLSNLETDNGKLLRIILVGQPELRTILSAPAMLQLRQRIQVNCHIDPLSAEEVEEYILYRLEQAGNREALLFGEGAMEAIHSYSRGIPRLVNILCDYIMLDASAVGTREVTADSIHDLARELTFEAQYWQSDAREDREGREAGKGSRLLGSRTKSVSKTKLHGYLSSLSRRLSILEEESGRLNQAAFYELAERVEKQERDMQRFRLEVRELKGAADRVPAEGDRAPAERDRLPAAKAADREPLQGTQCAEREQQKQSGSMRTFWTFLWGE